MLGQFQDVGKDYKKNVNTFQVLLHISKLVYTEIKFGYTATSSMIIAFSLVLGTINFGIKNFALFLSILYNYSWCLNILTNIYELLNNMTWSYILQKNIFSSVQCLFILITMFSLSCINVFIYAMKLMNFFQFLQWFLKFKKFFSPYF